ncbi:MAG: nucleotidyltransferase family protein [Sedimenticola sp.]
MLLDKIHSEKKKILSLGGKYGARRIRVFGSVARGEERVDSDVDFLVDFPHGYDLLRQRLPLAEQLQALLGHRVDVVPEHELNPYIREQVLNEAVDL